jgi:hypothetical protein
VIALCAAAALMLATGVKLWASLTLLHRYRAEDYVNSSESRRIYAAHIGMPVVMGSAILVLSYCTGLWWVEVPAWLILALTIWKFARALYVRLSGRYAGV